MAHPILTKTLRNIAFGTTALVAGFVVTATTGPAVRTQEPPTPPATAAPTMAELLVERHRCWTGEGPQGVIPGHAIVTRDGVTRRMHADVGFAIWLEDAPGTLHAFCP